MAKLKTVFLDRDGTINREVDFLCRPQDVRLLPGVAAGLKLLKNAGFMLVVVSNQSGLARGRFSEADLAAVQLQLKRLLAAEGAALDGAYFCPHHPQEGVVADLVKTCACRKPKPGLILMAAE
jgi:D,D-heptose 1,7-bisphosphate phosphatase